MLAVRLLIALINATRTVKCGYNCEPQLAFISRSATLSAALTATRSRKPTRITFVQDYATLAQEEGLICLNVLT